MTGVGKCTILEQGVVLKAGIQRMYLGFFFLIREIHVALGNASKSKTMPFNYL